MNRKDVLVELIGENKHYIYDILDNGPQDLLHWTTEGLDNSIAVTTWHVARACDVFLTLHVKGLEAADEYWFAGGWAEKTGYDPRGIGTHGWGMITGYTLEEVQAVPHFQAEDLKGYFDAVMTAVQAYLDATPDEQLNEKAPGFEGKQPNWFWVRHPLFDMTRHVGEMMAIRSLWNQQNP